MTDQRFNADNVMDGDSRPRQYCLAPIAAAAPAAIAGLLLAVAEPSPAIATTLEVGLWCWLALSMAAVTIVIAKAVRMAVDRPEITNPLHFMPRFFPVCAWISLGLLAVATGGLFTGGVRTLAVIFEILLLFALAVNTAPESAFGPEKKDDAWAQDYTPIASGLGAFWLAMTVGAVWLALGSPPGWAKDMILTYFWMLAVVMLIVSNAITFSLTVGRSWLHKHYDYRRQRGERIDVARSLTPTITPEPPRPLGQQINMWLWRASWVVEAWALWTAGQQLLASLFLLASLCKLAVRVRARREKHGESARIDALARAVHFIFWWPLAVAAVVGLLAAVVIFLPLGIVGAVYHVFAGKTPAQPPAESERDARVRKARIRRAAASYRLREAFGKPEGFVYFMCSEPHQRDHFLGPGGLLADLGDRVVARDYRRHVLETRTTYNWMAFEQAPEGALLHVNGVSNMRRDLPFVAIVPPHGRVQTFRLSEPYRARSRDKGAALKEAETEIRTAIAAAGL